MRAAQTDAIEPREVQATRRAASRHRGTLGLQSGRRTRAVDSEAPNTTTRGLGNPLREPRRQAAGRDHTDWSLPVAISSFVGRQGELAQVRSLLQTARLLTLTGSGGVGKTRLALEVARELAAADGQRVCLVELASISDSTAVPEAVATALVLHEQPGRRPTETIVHFLKNQELLLVLDNCEHILQGCAEIADAMLGACPHVRILATSRERLGIFGEITWRVPSLTVPSGSMPLDQIAACDATQLFLQRASALVPEFVLSDDNASAVAHLCTRLDGIPLAIELAAAQLPALSVQQIAERLDDALRLLVHGNRVAPARQQTLRAAVAWSYALLQPAEQLVFERLSVFAGGWSLEAAEYVCADPDDSGDIGPIRRKDVVDLLTRLVAKSLVVATLDENGAMRYRMLETLRQYGRERLVEHSQLDATNDRHADFFVSWARRNMPSSETLLPLRELSVESDNLRLALRWLLCNGDTHRILRLGAAMRWYWFELGRLSEGAHWYSQILDRIEPDSATEEYAHVVAAAGLIAGRAGKIRDGEQLLHRAVALWQNLGNESELARSLSQLGYLCKHMGQLDLAQRYFNEGLRLSKDQFALIEAVNRIGLAETMYDAEQYDAAMSEANRVLDLFQSFEYARGLSWAKRAIGLIHYQLGAISAARHFLEESLEHARKDEGRGWWLADALACVAQLDVGTGRFDRARTLLTEALELSSELGDQRCISRCLERLAYLAAAQAQYKRALRLASGADALRTAAGLPRAPVESHTIERWLAPAMQGLEPTLRDQLHREGATMDVQRLLADAIEATESSAGAAAGSVEVARASQLSPREWEVGQLVADGLTNPRIASELIIGERTVQTHVSNILSKLGLSSRVQIARWMAEHTGSAAIRHDP